MLIIDTFGGGAIAIDSHRYGLHPFWGWGSNFGEPQPVYLFNLRVRGEKKFLQAPPGVAIKPCQKMTFPELKYTKCFRSEGLPGGAG